MVLESKDWRPFCSPIRNQGNCGSCVAFGIIGAWETAFRAFKNNTALPIDISERELFFCSGGLCERGNTMDRGLNGAKKEIACEADSPYVDVNCTCGSGLPRDWKLRGLKIASWERLKDEQMKEEVKKQPTVGIMYVHESFLHYVDGVYENLGPSDPIVGAHCISVVGFDDKKGAWLIRNSWGTGWGKKGYCWIKYGDSCLLGMYSILPCKPDGTPYNGDDWIQKVLDFLAKYRIPIAIITAVVFILIALLFP